MFYIDKQRAIKHQWRISESALLLSAFIGGSFGAAAGMKIFRHKTKHPKFYILVPALLIDSYSDYYYRNYWYIKIRILQKGGFLFFIRLISTNVSAEYCQIYSACYYCPYLHSRSVPEEYRLFSADISVKQSYQKH